MTITLEQLREYCIRQLDEAERTKEIAEANGYVRIVDNRVGKIQAYYAVIRAIDTGDLT